MTTEEKYEFLSDFIENEITGSEGHRLMGALDCLTSINGFNGEAIDDFIYWWTGYDFDNFYQTL